MSPVFCFTVKMDGLSWKCGWQCGLHLYWTIAQKGRDCVLILHTTDIILAVSCITGIGIRSVFLWKWYRRIQNKSGFFFLTKMKTYCGYFSCSVAFHVWMVNREAEQDIYFSVSSLRRMMRLWSCSQSITSHKDSILGWGITNQCVCRSR